MGLDKLSITRSREADKNIQSKCVVCPNTILPTYAAIAFDCLFKMNRITAQDSHENGFKMGPIYLVEMQILFAFQLPTARH